MPGSPVTSSSPLPVPPAHQGLVPAAARRSTQMISISGIRARAKAAAATRSTRPTKATMHTQTSLRRSLAGAARHSIGLVGSAGSPRHEREANHRRGPRGRNGVKTRKFRSRSRLMRRSGEPNGRFNCRSQSRAQRAAVPAKCEVRNVRPAMARASFAAPRRSR
jgi:hypothetical protein